MSNHRLTVLQPRSLIITRCCRHLTPFKLGSELCTVISTTATQATERRAAVWNTGAVQLLQVARFEIVDTSYE